MKWSKKVNLFASLLTCLAVTTSSKGLDRSGEIVSNMFERDGYVPSCTDGKPNIQECLATCTCGQTGLLDHCRYISCYDDCDCITGPDTPPGTDPGGQKGNL